MSNNDNKSYASTSINYEKLICRNISKTIENTKNGIEIFTYFYKLKNIKINSYGGGIYYEKI